MRRQVRKKNVNQPMSSKTFMYSNRESQLLEGRKAPTDKYEKPPFWAESVGLQGSMLSIG
jgi:hypothetical protein